MTRRKYTPTLHRTIGQRLVECSLIVRPWLPPAGIRTQASKAQRRSCVSSTCGGNSWHGGMQGVRWQARVSVLRGQHFGGPGQSGGSMLSAFANPLSILNAANAGNTGKLLLVQRPASSVLYSTPNSYLPHFSLTLHSRNISSVGLEHYFDRVGVTGSSPVCSTLLIISDNYYAKNTTYT